MRRRWAQAVRKELTRRDLAIRGLAALAVLALALTFLFMRSTGQLGGPRHVSAELRDAGGSLANGADVKVRGVIIGRVTGIGAGSNGGVRVDISIPQTGPGHGSGERGRPDPAGHRVRHLVRGPRPRRASRRDRRWRPARSSRRTRPRGPWSCSRPSTTSTAWSRRSARPSSPPRSARRAQALDGRGHQARRHHRRGQRLPGQAEPEDAAGPGGRAQARREPRARPPGRAGPAAATNDALVTARTIVDQKAAIATLISEALTLTTQANASCGGELGRPDPVHRQLRAAARRRLRQPARRHHRGPGPNKLLSEQARRRLHDGVPRLRRDHQARRAAVLHPGGLPAVRRRPRRQLRGGSGAEVGVEPSTAADGRW